MNIRDNRQQFYSLIAIALFGLYIFIAVVVGKIETYNLSFKGTIQKVIYYEPKHEAHPIINGKEIDLIYSSCESMDTLAVGDSLVKEKGDMHYRLFKK